MNIINNTDIPLSGVGHRTEDIYFEQEKICIRQRGSFVEYIDLRNAQKKGKTCRHIRLTLKDSAAGGLPLIRLCRICPDLSAMADFICLLFGIAKDCPRSVGGFLIPPEGAPVYCRILGDFYAFLYEKKGVQVYSPFYQCNPIREPSRWTSAHIRRALFAGQFSFCCQKEILKEPSGGFISTVQSVASDYILERLVLFGADDIRPFKSTQTICHGEKNNPSGGAFCKTEKEIVFRCGNETFIIGFNALPGVLPDKERAKISSFGKNMARAVSLRDYSADKVAIIGGIEPFSGVLSSLGGTYCPNLKIDGNRAPGWLFSRDRENDLADWVLDIMG